jgi:hypothetical protein
MDRLPETNVLGARHEARLHDVAIGLEPQIQSGGVGLATDKA